MKAIHISTLRSMLRAGDPVDLKLWTNREKSAIKRAQCQARLSIAEREQIIQIQEWRTCVPLRYNFYKGTQQFKLLNSGQIRQARICCIFEINNLEVFL